MKGAKCFQGGLKTKRVGGDMMVVNRMNDDGKVVE